METTKPYKVMIVFEDDKTYYQVVRKRDDAILYANESVECIAGFIVDEGIAITEYDLVPEFANNHIF